MAFQMPVLSMVAPLAPVNQDVKKQYYAFMLLFRPYFRDGIPHMDSIYGIALAPCHLNLFVHIQWITGRRELTAQSLL